MLEGADGRVGFAARRRVAAAVAASALVVAACSSASGAGLSLSDLEDEPALTAAIPGTTNSRITESHGGNRPSLTLLMDVTGEWNAVSVEIARAVRVAGWTITSVNCVGTGNDVIAKKQVGTTWVLLESGAGTRGAGIILRYDPDQTAPLPFATSGTCPQSLIRMASG